MDNGKERGVDKGKGKRPVGIWITAKLDGRGCCVRSSFSVVIRDKTKGKASSQIPPIPAHARRCR